MSAQKEHGLLDCQSGADKTDVMEIFNIPRLLWSVSVAMGLCFITGDSGLFHGKF
jgi:hypothetical protein